ncbi:MAG TPA: hypothetical protein PLP17_06810, partial [Oligoflexia bacterium]|nr:hypothetical protein [Oligoflexia bacterium]
AMSAASGLLGMANLGALGNLGGLAGLTGLLGFGMGGGGVLPPREKPTGTVEVDACEAYKKGDFNIPEEVTNTMNNHVADTIVATIEKICKPSEVNKYAGHVARGLSDEGSKLKRKGPMKVYDGEKYVQYDDMPREYWTQKQGKDGFLNTAEHLFFESLISQRAVHQKTFRDCLNAEKVTNSTYEELCQANCPDMVKIIRGPADRCECDPLDLENCMPQEHIVIEYYWPLYESQVHRVGKGFFNPNNYPHGKSQWAREKVASAWDGQRQQLYQKIKEKIGLKGGSDPILQDPLKDIPYRRTQDPEWLNNQDRLTARLARTVVDWNLADRRILKWWEGWKHPMGQSVQSLNTALGKRTSQSYVVTNSIDQVQDDLLQMTAFIEYEKMFIPEAYQRLRGWAKSGSNGFIEANIDNEDWKTKSKASLIMGEAGEQGMGEYYPQELPKLIEGMKAAGVSDEVRRRSHVKADLYEEGLTEGDDMGVTMSEYFKVGVMSFWLFGKKGYSFNSANRRQIFSGWLKRLPHSATRIGAQTTKQKRKRKEKFQVVYPTPDGEDLLVPQVPGGECAWPEDILNYMKDGQHYEKGAMRFEAGSMMALVGWYPRVLCACTVCGNYGGTITFDDSDEDRFRYQRITRVPDDLNIFKDNYGRIVDAAKKKSYPKESDPPDYSGIRLRVAEQGRPDPYQPGAYPRSGSLETPPQVPIPSSWPLCLMAAIPNAINALQEVMGGGPQSGGGPPSGGGTS